MKKRVVLIAVLAILFINLASASIILSQPKANYNLGDDLLVEAQVIAEENRNSVFDFSISCSEGDKSFYSETLVLSSGEQKKIAKVLTLTDSFLEGMSGVCYVKASYGDEETQTTNFHISGEIDVSITLNKKSLEPGEIVEISGTALKNSRAVEGTAEAVIDSLNLKSVSSISNSKFSLNFSVPVNAESGEYQIKINAYEKDKIGEISNQGVKIETISLKQIPNKIEVETNKQSFKPGDEITFKVQLYDQSNKKIEEDLTVRIFDSYGEEVLKKLIKTDNAETYELEKNSGAGYWKFQVEGFNIESKRLFYVEELQEASFEIFNDTLVVTNVGNVIYKKTIQVQIGNDLEIKTLDLDVGESKSFRLAAPNGEYSVSVTDGSNTYSESNVALTGNVVSVNDVRKQLSLITKYPIVWLFIIVLGGLFVLMFFERYVKKKNFGFIPQKIKRIVKKGSKEPEEGGLKVEDKAGTLGDAKHELVLKGKKEQAGIISLNVKDNNDKKLKQILEKSIEKIKGKKGRVYKKGDSIIGILTPSITKTFKNELNAVKVAQEIGKSLEEYNKDAEKKIDFGLGVHSGNIINKEEKGEFKFTSLGDSLSKARKLSGKSKGSVLLSKQATEKLGSEVRTEKKGEDFEIKRVIDREQHKAFIQGFLKRMQGNNKK